MLKLKDSTGKLVGVLEDDSDAPEMEKEVSVLDELEEEEEVEEDNPSTKAPQSVLDLLDEEEEEGE